MAHMEQLLHVRDFLMRTALYQSTEFGRDEIRREARSLLRDLDNYLKEELEPAQIAPERVPDTSDIRQTAPAQGERPVNQNERRPEFTTYFPQNGTGRRPGRPKTAA